LRDGDSIVRSRQFRLVLAFAYKLTLRFCSTGIASGDNTQPICARPTQQFEIEFVDLPATRPEPPIRFTFLWLKDNRWEGRDYTVAVWARIDSQARKEPYGELADRVA
jgi:hypothetical protein